MTNEKPMITVLSRVPPLMLAAMDQAASEMRQTRSAFLRDSVHERIARYNREERALILMLRQQAEAAHRADDQKEGY